MKSLEELIPASHRYAVRAARTNILSPMGETMELAPGLHVLSGLPPEIPKHWDEWLGSRETSRLRRSTLVVVAVDGTADVDELRERVWYYHHALVVVTPGLHSLDGRVLAGRNRDGYIDATVTEQTESAFATAGTPEGWGVSPAFLRQAETLARQLAALRETGDWKIDRLGRTLHAFFVGIETRFMDERLHQFCRVLDGLTAPRNFEDFGERVCAVVGDTSGTHRKFFEIAYKTRGAVEHLRGPVDAIRRERADLTNDTDAFVHLAFMGFVMEQVARHAIKQLGAEPQLWAELRTKEAAHDLWATKRARAEELWSEPLGVAAVMRAFDRQSAERGIVQVNRQRRV